MQLINNKRPAAFLDRDGVLVRDHGYVYRLQDLEILSGVWEGLEFLHQHSYLLIMISNQSGVARGHFTCEQVDAFHAQLQGEMLKHLSFQLDGIYYCPHHPKGVVPEYTTDCVCRKPSIGMIEAAGRDFDIDWGRSLVIGDKDTDIACAYRAGLLGIQVFNDQYPTHSSPDFEISSLADLSYIWSKVESRLTP